MRNTVGSALLSVLLIAVFTLAVSTKHAYAYIDPGSGKLHDPGLAGDGLRFPVYFKSVLAVADWTSV
jgi:hypothetical protein